ncbi:MAG: hypothetical protein ACI4VQ_06625 [Clostridia bacterium]
MKKYKKNYIAIVLIVILLALAVGYAAFSSQLKITGTATAGAWDVKFTAASASSSIVENPTADNSATVTDEKTVTVNVYLNAEGDGSNVTATITNDGTVDAKLTGFEVTGDLAKVSDTVYQTGVIKLTLPAVTDGDVIAAGASKTFAFSVEWDTSVTDVDTTTEQVASFDITFTYEQDGVSGSFTGTQSFN